MSKDVRVIDIDTGDPDSELDVSWGPLYGPGWLAVRADERIRDGSMDNATAKVNIDGAKQLRDACDKFLKESDEQGTETREPPAPA